MFSHLVSVKFFLATVARVTEPTWPWEFFVFFFIRRLKLFLFNERVQAANFLFLDIANFSEMLALTIQLVVV